MHKAQPEINKQKSKKNWGKGSSNIIAHIEIPPIEAACPEVV
jgi:hypothetical protein